ncbi:autotransporter outer membrane beta-barrel domain-containing protein [Helicobacter pullorum]|uniref:autotransporter outer membrane beta-barrel domain-containing protein n=1 Tax=Helicobacter pullorum TaxID=35818 RepID=UPI001066518C|nr:autotransporter outer membrane beta-barrel domain-containing protein [Helicobacter pullorum]
MRKFLILSLACSSALAVNNGDTWAGSFQESNVTLNDGDNIKVTLAKDSTTTRGNNFGYNGGTNFEYSTTLGSSTLIFEADSSIKDMAYYHKVGNTITINQNSNLIWNLNTSGGFIVNGAINVNGGTLTLNKASILDKQAEGTIRVSNGGILNVTNVNTFKNVTGKNANASLINDGGIINIVGNLYNNNHPSFGSSKNGGYILQNDGTTTIGGIFDNSGFSAGIDKDGQIDNGQRTNALLEIKGGIFEVKGNFENGKKVSSPYYSYDYFGQGTLNASGDSEVIVGNDFISDAQGEDLAGGGVLYHSSVNLSDNAILRVGNSFKAYRSDISLTDLSSIYTKDFFLDTTANIKFIGGGSGFGSINASNSATFDGGVEFKLANPLMQTDNKTYLILDTPSLNGTSLQEGKVEVIGSSGGTINNAEIVKVGDKYYLSFNGAIPPIDPDIGGGDGNGGSGGDSGNGGSDGGNTGGGGETGGDSGDSENGGNQGGDGQGGNEGGEPGGDSGDSGQGGNPGGSGDSDVDNPDDENQGGDNNGDSGNGGNQGSGDLGGGSESGGDNPQKPNRPTSNNPVYNAIYEALVGKGGIIDDEATLHKATQTIEKQLDHIKEGPKSYQGSVMHHNMLGRIAHTTRTQYALNSQQKYASIAGDYVRMPYFEKEETKNNVYVNVLAGYSHYKDSDTSDYGINFGYDKEIKDSFFGGIYGSVSKRNMKAENMDLDGYNYNIGLYGRSHLTKTVELDMLGYYTNSQSEYTRTFAGIGNNTASYDTHNIGFQARLGYRVKFENGHSLKPYIGFFGSYYHMPQYKENGNVLPITRSENDFMNLYGAVGVEYRKINENGGSFFVAIEGVQGKPVFGDKDYEVRMGVSRIKYENEEEFFGSVFAGANLPISENWDLSATVMAQAYDNGLTSVSGSVGLRYAF